MSRLLITALLSSLCFYIHGQGREDSLSIKRALRVKHDLLLDSAQQQELARIEKDQFSSVDSLRKAAPTLPENHRRKLMAEIQNRYTDQLLSLLSDEQRKKYQEKRAFFRQRRNNRRNELPPGD